MFGTADIDAVLAMPAEQFDEWRMLFNHEPWGEERLEWCLGVAASILHGKGRSADWYMPFLSVPRAEQSEDQIRAIVANIPGMQRQD